MEKVWIFFVVFALMGSTVVFAEGPQGSQAEMQNDLRKICAEIFCRPPLEIKFHREDGSVFESNTKTPLPIVQGGMATVYPGETVYLEAEAGPEGLQNIRAVEKISDPSKTLIMEFQQRKDEKSNQWNMHLKITNPFSRPIKYHAATMRLDEKVYKTSSCPVLAKGVSYESWPNSIYQLIVTNFKFVSSEETKCEY